MVGWHHRLDGHGFGWTLGVGDGQRGLACCGSWGRKESDTMEDKSNIHDKSLAMNQPYILWERVLFSPGVADHFKGLKFYKRTMYPYCSHLSWFFFAISCLGSWIPSNCTAGLALEISHFDPHNQTGWTARQIHGFPHKNLQHVPQWCEGTTGILWVSHQLTER